MSVVKPVLFHLVIICTVVVIANQCEKHAASPEEKKISDEINNKRDEMKKEQEKVKALVDRIAAEIESETKMYGCSAETDRRNFQFSFSSGVVEDYVSLNLSSSAPSLSAFTLCQWINIGNEFDGGTLFSYSLPDEDNELLLIDYSTENHLLFMVGGKNLRLSVTSNDGQWHHICATWENTAGTWNGYANGKLKKSAVNFKTHHVIKSGGILILGQDQDEFGGGFQEHQSFLGKMSGVNLWSSVLSPEEIERMSEDCFHHEEGDYLSWSDLRAARLHGDVRIESPTECSHRSGPFH